MYILQSKNRHFSKSIFCSFCILKSIGWSWAHKKQKLLKYSTRKFDSFLYSNIKSMLLIHKNAVEQLKGKKTLFTYLYSERTRMSWCFCRYNTYKMAFGDRTDSLSKCSYMYTYNHAHSTQSEVTFFYWLLRKKLKKSA